MNKRGQFFLAATFVIIGVLIGLTTIANFVIVNEDRDYFYDLSKEVGFETKKVIDYSHFNAQDAVQLTEDFISDYSNYIGQDKVIFLYGDNFDMRGLVFQEGGVGSVGIDTGGGSNQITIQDRTGEEANVIVNGADVSVEIDGIIHEFELRQGKNLFYIIKKEESDETLVAEG